jgi:hypothetical protein
MLENTYSSPRATLEYLLYFVHTIPIDIQQDEEIVVTSDLSFDMLQSSNAIFVFFVFHGKLIRLRLHTTKGTSKIDSMLYHLWKFFPNDSIIFSIFDSYLIDHHAICFSIPLKNF